MRKRMTLFRVKQKHLPKNPKIHFRSITSLFLSFSCVSIQPRNINFSFSALLFFSSIDCSSWSWSKETAIAASVAYKYFYVFSEHTHHIFISTFLFLFNCVCACVCVSIWLILRIAMTCLSRTHRVWAHQSPSWAIPIECKLRLHNVCCSICVHAYKYTFIRTRRYLLGLKLDYSTYHVAMNAIHTCVGRCVLLTTVGPGQTLSFSFGWRSFFSVVADVRWMVDDTLLFRRLLLRSKSVNFHANELMVDEDHKNGQ